MHRNSERRERGGNYRDKQHSNTQPYTDEYGWKQVKLGQVLT